MTSEVEGAVERLTEVMNDAIADHEDDVARAWEDGERPDLWDAPDVTVSIPDLRRVLAALRAQAERVRVLEGERDAFEAALTSREIELRDINACVARAEAAERRAGELEGALSALIVHFEGDELHDEGAFDIECPDCVALEAARALLPATQAEGEKP